MLISLPTAALGNFPEAGFFIKIHLTKEKKNRGLFHIRIILDFSKCKYLGEIHSLLKEKFGFHDYYGENWDALWDLMQDVFSDDKEYTVELCEFNSLNIELRTECEKMLKIFDRVAQLNFKFSYKIVS